MVLQTRAHPKEFELNPLDAIGSFLCNFIYADHLEMVLLLLASNFLHDVGVDLGFSSRAIL